MNVNDFLKLQLMSSVGSSPLKNFMVLTAVDKLTPYIPAIGTYLKSVFCRSRFAPSTVGFQRLQPSAVIQCERIMGDGNAKTQQVTTYNRMDSVIHYITTIPAIKNLIVMIHHDYLPNDFEEIQIEDDLYFQLIELNHHDGKVELIKFKIFCYKHDVQYIQRFFEKCNADYERTMKNKLGTSLFYFDMMVNSKSKNSMQNPLPSSHIIYTKHEFHTTRTFGNVFFEEKKKVENHVNFFLKRRDWYEKKGIPYTLGFMFHGQPGCGKTSTIKAIANTTRRHIINIHLSEIKSKAQLQHLFFNEEIHVNNGLTVEKYTIPLHARLYVIEDIDAMGDVVLRREYKQPTSSVKSAPASAEDMFLNREPEQPEQLDLSFLLNLLDGTLESSGRILAISSNFPERIDRALIRPGRIDMIIHFKKCNLAVLNEMVSSFYDADAAPITDTSCDYKWSPAEVNQILFRNFNSMETAIEELKTIVPTELYGFTQES